MRVADLFAIPASQTIFVVVQREMGNFCLQLREYLAFRKEVF